MRVEVRCFAQLRELAADRTEIRLDVGATVADAWAALAASYPALDAHRPYVRPARNGVYVAWDLAVADDDVIAFLPPVSGGARASLVDGPIDIAGLERGVADAGRGAVVTFVGRARDIADDGRSVLALEYETYPEMAEAVLSEIAAEAETRWPVAVAVSHRHGPVPIGEAAVAIVTAARHRGEAYDANRYVIEAIKDRLPIWKREVFADGSAWKRTGA